MKCIGFEELDAYDEGECSPKRQKEIEEHLSVCEKCRKKLQTLNDPDSIQAIEDLLKKHKDILPGLVECFDDEMVAAIVEGSLGVNEFLKAQEHMEKCDHCRKEVKSFKIMCGFAEKIKLHLGSCDSCRTEYLKKRQPLNTNGSVPLASEVSGLYSDSDLNPKKVFLACHHVADFICYILHAETCPCCQEKIDGLSDIYKS